MPANRSIVPTVTRDLNGRSNKQNFAAGMSEFLKLYEQFLPAIAEIENQSRSGFMGANLTDASNFLFGVDGAAGLAGLQSRLLGGQASLIDKARGADLRNMTGDARAVRGLLDKLSPEAASAIDGMQRGANAAQNALGAYSKAAGAAMEKYAPLISPLHSTVSGIKTKVRPTVSGIDATLRPTMQGFSPTVTETAKNLKSNVDTTARGLMTRAPITASNVNPNVETTITNDFNPSDQTAMADQMAADSLARSRGLNMEERRAAEQAARQASSARGRLFDQSASAAEILNRDVTMRANRAEASSLGQQAFDQRAAAEQIQRGNEMAAFDQNAQNVARQFQRAAMEYDQQAGNLGREVQKAGMIFDQDSANKARQFQRADMVFNQKASNKARQFQKLDTLYDQRGQNFTREMQRADALYNQRAQNVNRELTRQGELFDQRATGRQLANASRAQGFNMFLQDQAARQGLRDSLAQRRGELLAGSAGFYSTPGLNLLNQNPQSLGDVNDMLGLGLGGIGSAKPMLLNPDAGINMENARFQNIINQRAARRNSRASMWGSLIEGGSTIAGAVLGGPAGAAAGNAAGGWMKNLFGTG